MGIKVLKILNPTPSHTHDRKRSLDKAIPEVGTCVIKVSAVLLWQYCCFVLLFFFFSSWEVSRRFLDNGSIFTSQHLAFRCAHLTLPEPLLKKHFQFWNLASILPILHQISIFHQMFLLFHSFMFIGLVFKNWDFAILYFFRLTRKN